MGRPTVDIVESAVKGGVTCVQLRDKKAPDEELTREAKLLKPLLSRYSIPLIINDRIDVAMAVDADGIHLGQSDMPIREARKLLGGNMIIGVSAESVDDAVRAETEGADYIGVSPVFMTTTKKDIRPPLGLEGVTEIRKRVRIPLVGIGGINVENVGSVIRAGADGIAVVSAIVSAVSPEAASRELLEKIQSALMP